MPRGFSGVQKAAADLEAKRRSGPGAGALWFKITSNQEAIVRFLEEGDDIFWAMMHEIPVEGRGWGINVPCLDQERDGSDCPGCERDLPRRFQGYINIIWYDAPIYKRDGDNKVVKDRMGDPVVVDHKPQVAIWSSGIRLFEELGEIDANYKGLKSRRFKVKRKGEKLDTKYHISPEDPDSGPQPLTDADKKLIDAKYDLAEFVKPSTYEDFAKRLDGGTPAVARGGNGDSAQKAREVNPFMRPKG